MKTGRYLIAVLSCLCLVSWTRPAAAQGDPIQVVEGLVVGVAEGDRITVNSFGTEIRVKLYGIAAPQAPKIDKLTGWYNPGQPYAEDAFRALSTKVLHQQVKVEIRKTLLFKDHPEQVALGVVHLDGRNINMEMVAEGWVWVYKRAMSPADCAHYTAAERLARSKKNGLWIQDRPQPPWEFKTQPRIRAKQS